MNRFLLPTLLLTAVLFPGYRVWGSFDDEDWVEWCSVFQIPGATAAEQELEVYQLAESATWSHPRMIRIERRGDEAIAHVRMTDGKAGYYLGQLIIDQQRRLTAAETAKLDALLVKAQIWTAPVKPAMTGLDGTSLWFHVSAEGRQRDVVRWSPRGAFHDLWQYTVGLFDWEAALMQPHVVRHFEQLGAFMAAAEEGQIERLSQHLQNGIPVDAMYEYKSALMLAVEHNQPSAVELLIEAGAAVDAAHLTLALSEGHDELVPLLLAQGIDPTPIFLSRGSFISFDLSVETVRLLVAHGLELETFGDNLLKAAVDAGNLGLTQYLLHQGMSPWTSGDDDTLVRLISPGETDAERQMRLQIFDLLVAAGARPQSHFDSADGQTLLHLSVTRDAPYLAEVLLQQGNLPADVLQSSNRQTPMHKAAIQGNLDMAKLLHAYGAQLDVRDAYGNTPMSYASSGGYQAFIEWLMQHGCKRDATTDLFAAVRRADLEAVTRLLAAGADVNAIRTDGYGTLMSPLLQALQRDHANLEELVGLLCASGADPTLPASTPALHDAAAELQVEVVRHMLALGVDVNVTNAKGETPLMKVGADSFFRDKEKESLEIMRLLVTHGADVKIRDEEGNTALIHASQRPTAAGLELLIKAGSDVSAENDDGFSALAHVMVHAAAGNSRYAIILIEAGAKVDILLPYGSYSAGVVGGERLTRRTVLQLAKDSGQDALVHLIEARLNQQAKPQTPSE